MDAKAIIILRKSHTKSNGKNTVYLRFYIGRKYKQVSLKIDVEPEFWNDKTKRVKNKAPNAIQKNNLIQKAELQAEKIILDARIKETDLTFEDFKRQFSHDNGKITMAEIAEMYMNDMVNAAQSTKNKYKSEISKLHDYKRNITLRECNTTIFINRYLEYLTLRNNAANTKNKTFSILGTLIKYAVKKNYAGKNIIAKNPVPIQPSKKEFLTADELQQVEKLLNDKSLKISRLRVLEYFLFACYTGLRWGDIKTLQYKHITEIEVTKGNTKEKIPFIIKVAEKTKNSSGAVNKIPITKKAKNLIGSGLPEQKIFNTVSGQTANRYIKELMQKAGIDKSISFHCTRHTFASYLMNNKTNTYIIKDLMAHTNIKVTQAYIKTLDYSIVDAMDKWND